MKILGREVFNWQQEGIMEILEKIDAFIYVFLAISLFSGYRFILSLADQAQFIRLFRKSENNENQYRSLINSGTFSVGLWGGLFLFGLFGLAVNGVISHTRHSGFSGFESKVPLFPGVEPIKVLPMYDGQGHRDPLTVGRYRTPVSPEEIISYYQTRDLPDGWEYNGMEGAIKILLHQGSSNTCSIIVLQKQGASGAYCELMYLYDESRGQAGDNDRQE